MNQKPIKHTVIALLSISAVLLAYFCVSSIIDPIKFQQTKEKREDAVIRALVNIRTAEKAFNEVNGHYTASFDTLVDFLRNGKIVQERKEGTLSDEQMEKGLTEAKVAAILRRGNAAEIAANGLEGFVRDSAFVPVLGAIFKDVYDSVSVNEIRYIPYSEVASPDGQRKEFELEAVIQKQEQSGINLPLFQAQASFESYLGDLDRQEILNITEQQEDYNRYPGLRVGDVSEPNNNAGNWEE
ncbi:MAG: hypothetical protein IJR32_02630 [Paludibacteraceae bacterium]|nr:hypothetical protein [Paludibacteraceae bacterium]